MSRSLQPLHMLDFCVFGAFIKVFFVYFVLSVKQRKSIKIPTTESKPTFNYMRKKKIAIKHINDFIKRAQRKKGFSMD